MIYIWKLLVIKNWTDWMKEICHMCSRSRPLSPSLPGDRLGHAGNPPGSAEKALSLGGVFSAGPKGLDQMSWNFIHELRSQFGTKFRGAHSGGGRQGGELNILAYMKGFLNEFFKTDPSARKLRQRSINTSNIVMCALNAHPLQELKVAILDPLWDSFSGVPRREFLTGGEYFAHA